MSPNVIIFSLLYALPSCYLPLTTERIDTLLNVFLAIAVDNLANAQELSEAEAEAEEEQEKVTPSSISDCM